MVVTTDPTQLEVVRESLANQREHAIEQYRAAQAQRTLAKQALIRSEKAVKKAAKRQKQAWKDYQSIKNDYEPKINKLRLLKDESYNSAQYDFDFASKYRSRGDHSQAQRHIDTANRYLEKSRQYIEERQRLIDALRKVKNLFLDAKTNLLDARSREREDSEAFNKAQAKCKAAKTKMQKVKDNYADQIDQLSAELRVVQATRLIDRITMPIFIAKAGVPKQYRNNVKLVIDQSGKINLYFGGDETPDGPNHGHYVFESDGNPFYKRDPHAPRGVMNYIKYRTST